MFSQKITRPTLDNYDKLISLLGENITDSFVPIANKENRFLDEDIYITVEEDKDILLSFCCVFGNGIIPVFIEAQFQTMESMYNALNIQKTIDYEKNNDKKDNTDDLKEISTTEQNTPRPKYKKLEIWKLYKKSLRKYNYKKQQMKVSHFREEADRKDLQRKFMFMYRYKIRSMYDNIINEKHREFIQHKTRVRTFVGMIKLLKYAKYYIATFYVNYKVIIAYEERIHINVIEKIKYLQDTSWNPKKIKSLWQIAFPKNKNKSFDRNKSFVKSY